MQRSHYISPWRTQGHHRRCVAIFFTALAVVIGSALASWPNPFLQHPVCFGGSCLHSAELPADDKPAEGSSVQLNEDARFQLLALRQLRDRGLFREGSLSVNRLSWICFCGTLDANLRGCHV